jgi:hypothetical protein
MAGHLDRVLIERALRDIDARGDLAKCSLRLEDA